MKKNKLDNRIIYLDLLRVFCVFSMILLHVAARNWYSVPVLSFDWQVLNFYDSLVRFCVPVFIMISGSIFLNPAYECSLKNLFAKKIFRIVTAYLFWSTSYAVFVHMAEFQTMSFSVLKSIAKKIILGHYHLWFLFTIIGLYLIVPFLREICKIKSLMEYYLILSFLFNCLANSMKMIPLLENTIIELEAKFNMHFIIGYSGYFVLGYYINKYQITKRILASVYACGVLSVIFTITFSSYLSIRSGEPIGVYSNLLPTTFFSSLAVFLFFKEKTSTIKMPVKAREFIFLLSKLSFGVYLVHDFVNMVLSNIFGLDSLSFNPVFSIPLISVLVFTISFIIVYIISKIPLLNKYIL